MCRSGGWRYGFRLNEPHGFVITNGSGVWLWDGGDNLTLVADEIDNPKCQMNDCIADPAGRLLAGLWFYDPGRDYELGKLIRIETDGAASVVHEGFHLPNGLGFSPDGGTLYLTDSVARCIFAYNYEVTSGTVSNRRVIVKVSDEEGIPDGMTVDAEGLIWSAHWYGSCVVRYDPDGHIERRIMMPAKQVSAVTFGGKDMMDLFVTSAAQPWLTPIMPPTYDSHAGYHGGSLYHLNLGIHGKPEFKARIVLK